MAEPREEEIARLKDEINNLWERWKKILDGWITGKESRDNGPRRIGDIVWAPVIFGEDLRDPVYIRLSHPASNTEFTAQYYTTQDKPPPDLFSLKRGNRRLHEVPRGRDERESGIRKDDDIEEMVVRAKKRPVILSQKLSSGSWMGYELTSLRNPDNPRDQIQELKNIKESLKLNDHGRFYLHDLNDPDQNLHPSWVKTTPVVLYALAKMESTGWVVSMGLLRLMASLNDYADFKSLKSSVSSE